MMMYQLPIDISARIARVTLATMSPPFHNASRPYGLSTTSTERVAPEAGAAGAWAGAAGGVAAVGGVAAGAAGCACACASSGMTAEAAATSSTAAETAKRVIFNIVSPG